MLHKASFKITAIYTAIILSISLLFSVVVYQLSSAEFNRGFQRQYDAYQNNPSIPDLPPAVRRGLDAVRSRELTESKARLIGQLALVNLLILVGGGVLSYFLARRTIAPIEEARETQARFTADASHELKTPITAMQTEIEVALMDDTLPQKQTRQLLNSNLEELSRLTALINGLLRLSQLEHRQVIEGTVPVADLLQDVTKRFTIMAKQKKVSLETTLPDEPLLVRGDVASISEAISVLVDNAIKYAPESSKVSINAKAAPYTIILTVEDNGPGIPDHEQAHIFERFYRVDTSRTKQAVEGYGLGLAIAERVVKAHHGAISYEALKPHGSRFSVKLPKATLTPKEEARPAISEK